MAGPTQRFYVTSTLSDHRALTPEGFLLITDVPIARIGTQVYAANELPAVEAGKDGLIIVERDAEEVFAPQTLASYNGKPFVDDHPPIGMLTPDNCHDYQMGTILNPRRGDGLQYDNDFMFGDILVTNKKAIEAINSGKKEISAGYDAEYEQLGPGRARCLNIVGNHVALVDRGRCGPHCAIGDQAMALPKSVQRARFMDRFRRAVKRGSVVDALAAVTEAEHDPEMLGEIISDEMMGGESGGGVHVHLHNGGGAVERPADDAEEGGGAAAGGAAAGGDPMANVLQRLDAIEKILTMLAQEEGAEPDDDDDEDGDREEMGDRRRTRDRSRRTRDRRSRDARMRDESESELEGEEESGRRRERNKEEAEDSEGWTEIDVSEAYGRHIPSLPRASGTSDRRRRAAVGDSTNLRAPFDDMVSKAEKLVPGMTFPTFVADAAANKTFDAMCSFKRRVLDAAYKAEKTQQVVKDVIGTRRPAFNDTAWTCDAISIAFNAASTMAGMQNSAHTFGGGRTADTAAKTVASINEMNRKAYGTA
jgi:hypothetical protein